MKLSQYTPRVKIHPQYSLWKYGCIFTKSAWQAKIWLYGNFWKLWFYQHTSCQHIEKRNIKSWNCVDVVQKLKELWIFRWTCWWVFTHSMMADSSQMRVFGKVPVCVWGGGGLCSKQFVLLVRYKWVKTQEKKLWKLRKNIFFTSE